MLTNTVLDTIRARRSTRQFEDKPVPPDYLDAMLDAAIWAPSGSNSQSWLFTAIANKDILLRVNTLIREAFKTYIPDDDYPAKHGAKSASQKEGYHFCYHAPVLIVASNRPGYENAMADCSLALENIFLAAHSMGLGSCYINSPHWLRDDDNLRRYFSELGIPREHTICSSAAIGFIAKPSPTPARKEGTINIIR